MKTAPEEIDPKQYPELACLQAIIHDEDRTPEGRWTSTPQVLETPVEDVLVVEKQFCMCEKVRMIQIICLIPLQR